MRFEMTAMALAAVATTTGMVDALVGGTEDLAVVFAVIDVLVLAAMARSLTGRRSVTLRPDLYVWLTRRSAASAEPIDAVLDRCVAAHRDAMHMDDAHV
jgi:hypothetical protein